METAGGKDALAAHTCQVLNLARSFSVHEWMKHCTESANELVDELRIYGFGDLGFTGVILVAMGPIDGQVIGQCGSHVRTGKYSWRKDVARISFDFFFFPFNTY